MLFGQIQQRQDGSFVITKDGHPYHVPNEGEFAGEWAYITDWLAKNNVTPEPESLPPEPEPPTPEEIQRQITEAIQKRLDSFAASRGYDGILSAASYATSTNATYQAEGQYCIQARDDTWAAAYLILAEVAGGERPRPTAEEVMAELPPLAWPNEDPLRDV